MRTEIPAHFWMMVWGLLQEELAREPMRLRFIYAHKGLLDYGERFCQTRQPFCNVASDSVNIRERGKGLLRNIVAD